MHFSLGASTFGICSGTHVQRCFFSAVHTIHPFLFHADCIGVILSTAFFYKCSSYVYWTDYQTVHRHGGSACSCVYVWMRKQLVIAWEVLCACACVRLIRKPPTTARYTRTVRRWKTAAKNYTYTKRLAWPSYNHRNMSTFPKKRRKKNTENWCEKRAHTYAA